MTRKANLCQFLSDYAQALKGKACLAQTVNFPKFVRLSWLPIGMVSAALCCFAQFPGGFGGGGGVGGPTDPGVQTDRRGTGGTIIDPNNDPNGFTAFFNDGLKRMQAVESVSHSPTGNNGLGPRFNSNSCSSCHAQPAVGGSGAANNPQFAFTTSGVAPGDNTPQFITAHGPTREARFPFFFNSNGTVNTSAPNGGVEDLFTVTGRPDAGSCNLQQPNFQAAEQANNVIFRIPTPAFGSGLIENLDDSTLLKNQAANLNNHFGIAGTFNRNGNDGTIARFGWKAQNKSLHTFSG